MIYLKSCDVDKMAATKEWLLSEFEQLIAVWESCVCLWDVTSKDYKDENKKKAAMLEIATKFETTDNLNSFRRQWQAPCWPCPHSFLIFTSSSPPFDQDT